MQRSDRTDYQNAASSESSDTSAALLGCIGLRLSVARRKLLGRDGLRGKIAVVYA
ncbi:hypothetical protein [Mycobacterium sp. D16Q16]|uniref:hypothetical protein n=1 Tax=Mycobacterium sp. D16Q16 TaxID=1855659 RepID=UPI001C378F5A|nr:hypothetical protein [Mycobacterium sp. D16Q16]